MGRIRTVREEKHLKKQWQGSTENGEKTGECEASAAASARQAHSVCHDFTCTDGVRCFKN